MPVARQRARAPAIVRPEVLVAERRIGMGASGAGDVKAGVIAGLCVRRAEPLQAGAWATYAHGRAGERLAARVGPTGFLARELLEEIPQVLVELAS